MRGAIVLYSSKRCSVLKKLTLYITIMREYKKMSDAKRLSLLKEYLSSDLTKAAFEREKGLSKCSISNWLRIFTLEDKSTIEKTALSMKKDTNETSLQDLSNENLRLKNELKIKELELRCATMARDAYNYMIDLAEQKYGISIRKNSDAK